MNGIDYLILAIIAVIFGIALYKTIKRYKDGKCCSGSGGGFRKCNSCNGNCSCCSSKNK